MPSHLWPSAAPAYFYINTPDFHWCGPAWSDLPQTVQSQCGSSVPNQEICLYFWWYTHTKMRLTHNPDCFGTQSTSAPSWESQYFPWYPHTCQAQATSYNTHTVLSLSQNALPPAHTTDSRRHPFCPPVSIYDRSTPLSAASHKPHRPFLKFWQAAPSTPSCGRQDTVAVRSVQALRAAFWRHATGRSPQTCPTLAKM